MPGPIDRRTVDQLVVGNLPRMLRLAQRLADNADVAEDIVQEALYRVLSRWKSYRSESSFSTWMMQIVVNVDRDRRRRHRDLHELLPELCVASTAEPDQNATATELGEIIRAAIHALPDRQREVALLTFGEGFDVSEVAEILQVTVANVHTCLHLARKRIARAIGLNDALGK